MKSHIHNLSRKTRAWPKKSHEEVEQDLAEFQARGGRIEPVPGFTAQSVKPRASYSFGNGAGPQ